MPSVKIDLFNDIYDFNHPKRGVAIFIINSSFHNQSKRPFAGEDIKKMRELFELLDFDVVLLENKTSVDLWKSLQGMFALDWEQL